MREAVTYTSALGGLTALGMGSPNAAFTSMSTVFGLRSAFYNLVITQYKSRIATLESIVAKNP